MKKIVAAVLLLGAIGGGGYWYYQYSKKPAPPTVTTLAVTRGDIVEAVSATGTLQAVTTVQVGSQVSGNIAYLGADFNSLVKKGQVLARLDPSLFEAQAQQSRASLAQARANLTKAQSELERTRVQLADTQQKYTRAKELSARRLLPQSDLDTSKTAVDTAQAVVQSQLATVTQTQAAITQSEAGVNQNQVNLDHTVITAPIDGLVISRNVDVGQTVAASMQAPTLFVLAADLTKMQVLANLDESDVGRIRPNQAVTFRVDAYPTETFRGAVSQVRLEPKVQQNVVTYATVISVPNNDLRLKPGMTANVNVEISRASNALRIANSAIRFRPSNEVFAALGQTPPEPQGRGGVPGGGRRAGGGDGNGTAPAGAPVAASGVATPPAGRVQPPVGSANAATQQRSGNAEQPSPAPQGEGMPATQGATNGTARGGVDAAATQAPDASGRGGFDAGRRGRGGRGGDATATAGADQAGGDQSGAGRRDRFAERMQNMSPEEREAMTARMRERGIDPSNPGAGGGRGGFGGGFGGRGGGPGDGSGAASGPVGRGGPQTAASPDGGAAPRRGAGVATQNAQSANTVGATTIDALFPPLPRTESFGRAWVYVNNQLRQIRLRLGITDGQNTEIVEVLGDELKEGAAVVTNVAIAGQATRPAANAFPGFGQPGRGGFPGGGFPGGGGPGGGGGGRGGR